MLAFDNSDGVTMTKYTLADMKALAARTEVSIHRQEALTTLLVKGGYEERVRSAKAHLESMRKKLKAQIDLIGQMTPD